MLSVNIRDFPEQLHHKAKILAATEKITLRELVIRAITEYIQKGDMMTPETRQRRKVIRSTSAKEKKEVGHEGN